MNVFPFLKYTAQLAGICSRVLDRLCAFGGEQQRKMLRRMMSSCEFWDAKRHLFFSLEPVFAAQNN